MGFVVNVIKGTAGGLAKKGLKVAEIAVMTVAADYATHYARKKVAKIVKAKAEEKARNTVAESKEKIVSALNSEKVSDLTSGVSGLFASLQTKVSDVVQTIEQAGQEGNVIDVEAVEVKKEPVQKKKPFFDFKSKP